MTDIEKLDQLIEKGAVVLATDRLPSPGVIGFPTLDTGSFVEWRSQCISFLERRLPTNSSYTANFKSSIKQGYVGTVKAGIGILKSLRQDLAEGAFSEQSQEKEESFVQSIERIADGFHMVAKQLRTRHDGRETIDVTDEYDVQDLFHALLRLYFADVRPEEWTPSYAGKSARMDFLLKEYSTVIESKMTRKGLSDKEIGSQLIEDIARYKAHPDCSLLYCFVYDPDGRISNPKGIENDLSDTSGDLKVLVRVRQ